MFNYNIFIGAENGFLKGLNTLSNTSKNLNKIEVASRDKEISALCWTNDETQDSVYYITKNNELYRYNCSNTPNANDNELISLIDKLEIGDGLLKGFGTCSDNIYTCTETGVVNVWSLEEKKAIKTFNVGSNITTCKKNPFNKTQIATGGKENDLKVWNLETGDALFKAKNVSDNWIQLREAIWIASIDFCDENRVAVGTYHHQLRIYDMKSGQRKPIASISYGEYPITAIAVNPKNNNQVIVGNTHGEMEMIDIKLSKPIKKYKSFCGTIRSMAVNPEHNCVATCGLDRFVRVHNIESSKMKNKIYLKSRLNCLLYSKYDPIMINSSKNKQKKEENCEAEEGLEDDDDDDILSEIRSEGTEDLWSDLDTIADKHPTIIQKKSKKHKNKQETNEDGFKKPKKFKK